MEGKVLVQIPAFRNTLKATSTNFQHDEGHS